METRNTPGSGAFTVAVPGGAIAGVDYGGPPDSPEVLLVHSVGYNLEVWRDLAPVLAEHARVISFDLRGHGQSSCDVDDPIEMLCDFRRVIDHLGLEAPILLGHQYGAGVAALAAALDPPLAQVLCAVDSPVTDTQAHYRELLELFATDDVMSILTYRFGLGVSGQGAENLDRFVEVVAARIVHDWLAVDTSEEPARRSVRRGVLVSDDGSWIRRPTPEACRRLVSLPDDFFARPGRELLERLDVPVWSLQPEKGDYVGGFDGFAEAAAQRPGWVARMLPGDMHVVRTHPKVLADEFRRLVARLSSGVAS